MKLASIYVIKGASLVAQWLLVVEHKLWGMRASVLTAHRFGCPVARGIFLDQRMNWCPLDCEVNS